ncbi:MAG: hypothetical protein H0U15_12750 [Geodermatophilaceae bacterium]|nr:hypothetical protein [Geodermatophilaceae bacterium]
MSLPDWLTAGGALLVFIFSFFEFAVPDVDIDAIAAQSCAGLGDAQAACEAQIQASYSGVDYGGANAWTSGLLSFGVILLLIVLAAIVAKIFKLIPANFPLHFVIAGIVLLVDILFLIEFLDILSTDGVAVGIGGWLALAALIVVNVGVAMSFLKAGGAKSLQGGISKLQQNVAQSDSQQGAPHLGYGPPAPGGYGQPGQQPPSAYGQGQPGQQGQGGYGQSSPPSPGAGYGGPPPATAVHPSQGQSQAPGAGGTPAPPPPYGTNPPAGGSGGSTPT